MSQTVCLSHLPRFHSFKKSANTSASIFFSVRLSCAIITYGVSGDILINQTKKTEEIIVVLFTDYSMEYVDPTVNVDGYKNFFLMRNIYDFLFFGYQSYLGYVFYFAMIFYFN